MKINYSFSLKPPNLAPKPAPAKLVEYSYNEFWLDLPEHWHQVPTPEENTFNWYSEAAAASITISADFYEVPEDKALLLAEKNLSSRLAALEESSTKQVTVLHRNIKPYSGGGGLELSFGAEVEGECVYLFLGYVTSRKIFNFGLVCKPGKHAAAALFNDLMGKVRVKLP